MTAVVIRGDARHLPLPDASVDLICCSPPYFGLRSYTDGGEHYGGQIGSESTPGEWVAALVECTQEWVRVLKPSGSLFVNLGDKYASGGGGWSGGHDGGRLNGRVGQGVLQTGYRRRATPDIPTKSLLGLPWRYALACVDELGLILRRDIIWSKPNGLPESVTDRCRSSHEYVFHLVVRPRYYAAVDEIREPHTGHSGNDVKAARSSNGGLNHRALARDESLFNPLGKLPGSVWTIPSQPLSVPAGLGVDHFAAFPMELPRRCILGWSPPGVCTACGEGRRPVVDKALGPPTWQRVDNGNGRMDRARRAENGVRPRSEQRGSLYGDITGYACGCTPYTDHPGGPGVRPADHGRSAALGNGVRDNPGGGYGNAERTGLWREYHLDGWTPPPTRPAVVVDPFGGTGTTALVASMYGRVGVSVDLSADYCRLARWRVADPAERARALQVAKPPPVPDGQGSLFDEDAQEALL